MSTGIDSSSGASSERLRNRSGRLVNVIHSPDDFLEGFLLAAEKCGLFGGGAPTGLWHQALVAPHKPVKLPPGFCAVYIFSLAEQYGSACPAGANRVLKVGKVGANSSARFSSQHYLSRSSRSNLANSLLTERVLWTYLGIDHLDELTVKSWMMKNLDRDHFFVPEIHAGLERELERYLRGHLGPVFEG